VRVAFTVPIGDEEIDEEVKNDGPIATNFGR
jgi:hypothetical protein